MPVLIVGAGPVGLSLALALQKLGVAVQVFEALPELSAEARASTFHPATLELFAAWGVLDALLARGYRVHSLQYWERSTRQKVAEFDYGLIAGDTPYPFRLQCPQSILTRILKPTVERAAPVYMDHTLVSLRDAGDYVEATFATPQGTKTVRGSYLCGADGARSTTRRELGLSFEGMTYADRFLLVATDIDFQPLFPGMGAVSYVFDPQEWVIILHLPDATRVVFRIRDDEDEHAIRAESALRARLRGFLGTEMAYAIKSHSLYSVHQRVADTFRVGRVLLLGDAAHINNPVGGFGMNSGIHDAHFLAPRLQRVLSGASHALLDEYAAKRRAYALHHVQQSTAQNYAQMSAAAADQRRARDAELRATAADPTRTRAYLLRASMLEDRI
ncbi:MAG: FAD-dependent monooxygenase [Chloroflexi bacterium]|nr:FAD-dependent monooxygenase [Chloroflexota bacterium]